MLADDVAVVNSPSCDSGVNAAASCDTSPAAHNAAPPLATLSNELPPTPAVELFRDVAASAKPTVAVCGLKVPRKERKDYPADSFDAAFSLAIHDANIPHSEPVIWFPSVEDGCFVDTDFHDGTPPDRGALTNFHFLYCPITPRYWWITHGGGLRWMFLPITIDGVTLTANQVAAAAVVLAHQHWRRLSVQPSGVELKRESRHPLYPKADGSMCGEVHGSPQSALRIGRVIYRLFGTLIGEYADDELTEQSELIQEKREELGLGEGARHSHERCPIRATPGDAKNNCVVVLDRGIHCHSCEAKGEVYPGCSKPGFVPYSLLLNPSGQAFASTPLAAMARHVPHWPHAKHVLRHLLGPFPEGMLWDVFAVLVHLKHEQIAKAKERHATAESKFDIAVYRAGIPKLLNQSRYSGVPLLRDENGCWLHAAALDRQSMPAATAAMLKHVPAAKFITDDGEVKLDPLRHARLINDGPIDDIGYLPVRPIRSVDARGQLGNLALAGMVAPIVVEQVPPFRKRSERMYRGSFWTDDERGWFCIQFPGVKLAAVKLLVGAAMYAQQPGTEPLRVAIGGQSGSAKSTTVKLAGEIFGVPVVGVSFQRDRDKWLRGIDQAAGGFAVSDEFAKSGLTAAELVALVLSVRKGERFHKLYHGPASLLYPGVHVFCDTQFPKVFREETQLSRRIIEVQLGNGAAGKDWYAESGGVDGWRARHETNTRAADYLVSEVLDMVRAHDTFDAFAATLGFYPMNKSERSGYDPNAPLKDLFAAVLGSPECRGGRWSGPGWRVFTPGDTTDTAPALVKAWAELEDESGTVDTQRLTGCQWGVMMTLPGLECDLHPHGRKIGIRFRIGSAREASARFGIDVLPPDHELRAKLGIAPPA